MLTDSGFGVCWHQEQRFQRIESHCKSYKHTGAVRAPTPSVMSLQYVPSPTKKYKRDEVAHNHEPDKVKHRKEEIVLISPLKMESQAVMMKHAVETDETDLWGNFCA